MITHRDQEDPREVQEEWVVEARAASEAEGARVVEAAECRVVDLVGTAVAPEAGRLAGLEAAAAAGVPVVQVDFKREDLVDHPVV